MNSFFEGQNEKPVSKHNNDVDTPEGKERCLEIINLILDGEATVEQMEYFNSKIKCCEKSMAFYDMEKCVKDVIQKKIDNKPVPQDLIDCIKSRLKG
jgi:hypothetical protein